MQILIVHNSLNDSATVSGVLKDYAYKANEWIAMGHPTDFLAAKAGFPQLRELAPKAGLLMSDGIFDASGHVAQTWRYYPAYAYRALTAHWVHLTKQYDVVLASSPFIVEVYNAMVLCRRMNVPWGVKIHHILITQKKRRGFVDWLFLVTERLATRWIHQRCEAVICNNRLVASDFFKLCEILGLPKRPVHEIGLGIDVNAFTVTDQGPKHYDAVFLGRVHEQKGVFELPLAWERVVNRHPSARLLVIGEGPRRPMMTDLFRQRNLLHTVTITGGVTEIEKTRLLSQCRVGISLSFEEGWGMSIMEFLAAGLPVVAYHLPVFDSVFPEQLDLVNLGDWQGLANRILDLLNDEPRQIKQGQRGREFIKRYSIRQIAEAELKALQEAVDIYRKTRK